MYQRSLNEPTSIQLCNIIDNKICIKLRKNITPITEEQLVFSEEYPNGILDQLIKYEYQEKKLLLYNRSNIETYQNDNFDLLWDLQKAQEWEEFRPKRDLLISKTDFLLNNDYSLPQEDRTLIEQYRQDLRDLPQVYDDIDDMEIPPFPELSIDIKL